MRLLERRLTAARIVRHFTATLPSRAFRRDWLLGEPVVRLTIEQAVALVEQGIAMGEKIGRGAR